jgi:4-cresol dehydrogenase (hydroxylating)
MTEAADLRAHFLDEVGRRVGDVEIVTGAACATRYRDPFALVPSAGAEAAIRPGSASSVQAIVQIANTFGAALWPISRGENLGYGGAAVSDKCIVLDLMRMNRILEVNVPDGFCLLEPGVSFVELFEHLEAHDIPLWLSVPGYGLGSVVGNALERGVGNSPYGDHAAQICGLEVVLGNGDLIRTGMGALSGSGMWQRQKTALGPRLDELFVQSNLGVVTKMGLWLMPEPEASVVVDVEIEERETLGACIEALASLKRRGLLPDAPVVSNYLTKAALVSRRSDWIDGSTPLDVSAIDRVRKKLGVGWWNAKIRIYGLPTVLEIALHSTLEAMRQLPACTCTVSKWRRGAPKHLAPRGVPSGEGLVNSRWCGSTGAHIDFAWTLPLSGAEVLRNSTEMEKKLFATGLDYHSSFYVRDRHVLNVVQILFDQQDSGMCAAIDALYLSLIADAARDGFGMHRVPLRYRAHAAEMFGFGGHALAQCRERLKQALDPNGVISPTKASSTEKV